MSVTSALSAGRRAALSRMTSTVRIWRPIVDANGIAVTTTDEDGYQVPAWEIIHDALPCRLTARTGAGQSRTVDTPGGDIQLASRELHVPAGTQGIADNDWCELISGENSDTVWRVVEADWADQQTALRLPVVGDKRPEEW